MQSLASISEYDQCLSTHTVTVVKFTADFCKPCRMLVPIFDELMEVYPAIKFVQVDIAHADKELVKREAIQSIPRIQFYVNGVLEEPRTLTGFNPVKLTQHIQELSHIPRTVVVVGPPSGANDADLARLVESSSSISSEAEDDDVVSLSSDEERSSSDSEL
jgi:thiol-disulfide isomerase/thioredoxin